MCSYLCSGRLLDSVLASMHRLDKSIGGALKKWHQRSTGSMDRMIEEV